MNYYDVDTQQYAKQAASTSGLCGTSTLGAPSPQQQRIGVNSALKNLIDAVQQNESLSYDVFTSLGLSQPEQAAKEPSSATVAEVIQMAASKVRQSSDRLSACLQHVNG